MTEAYFLSEDDRQELKRWLLSVSQQRQNLNPKPTIEKPGSAPEVYLCRVPCGREIPPLTNGNKPGYYRCCIFKLGLENGIDSPDDYIIEPIKWPNGEHRREMVYNIYDE